MKLKRIMIAAPKSGSGKTTVTCALLQLLKEKGGAVSSCKCGPDYIDPMFHKAVLGIPSKNLDTFFTDEEATRTIFLDGRENDETVVLEGVMGLYDGLGGIREEGSSYHLAKVTKTPILLVIDGKGMGRSVMAMIRGFLEYDTEKLIKGIFLNRVSKSFFSVLKPRIESELGISVVGYMEEDRTLFIKSRHLGLQTPKELPELREQLKNAAKRLQEGLDMEKLVRIMEEAETISCKEKTERLEKVSECSDAPVIAVARDEAFCFYYEDNLKMLERFGARLQYFSPLYDRKLPEGCAGLLLGGGYPELYADPLSKNSSMRQSIRNAIENGLPTVAECGGFLYLHESLEDMNGGRYEMAGFLPGSCSYKGKLVRFGYIEIEEPNGWFLPNGEKIRGHEFHYFDSSDNGCSCTAKKPTTGKTYPCVVTGENFWLGFPHLYYPSNPVFADRFLNLCQEYLKKGK